MKTLQVIEIFRSLQGESLLSGLPCTFVRLAGCNLACRWCDSGYAVRETGTTLTIDDIMTRVEDLQIKYICITGGEPLLQASSATLADRLLESGYQVSVETNGSLDISVISPDVCRVMDIKCPSSGECGSTRLSNLACLTPGDNLKFVIADRTDFDWGLDVIARHRLTASCPVLFSPAERFTQHGDARGTERLLSKARELAGWLMESRMPVRLQLQLHKTLWPDITRGV